MAAAHARGGQQRALGSTVHTHRVEPVTRARRVETTARPQERTDHMAVGQDQADQQCPQNTAYGCAREPRGRTYNFSHLAATATASPDTRRRARDKAASRSAASAVEPACAVPGSARTTTRHPWGNTPSRSRIRCRRRRATAWRTTEPPTARLTTKPARGSCPGRDGVAVLSGSEPARRCTTRRGLPALVPDRTVSVKSWLRRNRAVLGSTAAALAEPSGREFCTALAATRREDRASGAGVHPQPEAVGLGAPAVVRLESALAHRSAPNGGGDQVNLAGHGVPPEGGWNRTGAEWSSARPRYGACPDRVKPRAPTGWPPRPRRGNRTSSPAALRSGQIDTQTIASTRDTLQHLPVDNPLTDCVGSPLTSRQHGPLTRTTYTFDQGSCPHGTDGRSTYTLPLGGRHRRDTALSTRGCDYTWPSKKWISMRSGHALSIHSATWE